MGSKFALKEYQTYPFRVDLRPRDPNISMESDLIPWLDENVKWEGKWTLEFDGPTLSAKNMIYRFRVASLDDAILIRLKYA
jgi:hypothetical protein